MKTKKSIRPQKKIGKKLTPAGKEALIKFLDKVGIK